MENNAENEKVEIKHIKKHIELLKNENNESKMKREALLKVIKLLSAQNKKLPMN